jgi:hypothetical protein
MPEICLSGSEGGAKHAFVPTPISAQGFNPGKRPPGRRALKGCQIRRCKMHAENELAHVISRPFRANRVIEYFPGLKPWAESSSPFGA